VCVCVYVCPWPFWLQLLKSSPAPFWLQSSMCPAPFWLQSSMSPSQDDPNYPGSRQKRARYNSSSAFIELTPAASAGEPKTVIEAFRQSLTAVRGVDRVDLHPKGSKTQQGNVGEHYQEHNFAVYPAARDRPNTFIEFQLTRHLHSSSGPFTVSATYKNPPPALIPEAWRILRAACACKELLPNVVNEMEEKILKKWKSEYGGDSVEVGHQMTAESGSANSATRQQQWSERAAASTVSAYPKQWCACFGW